MKHLISTLLPISLLALWYYTQHPAFLFVYGVLLIFTIMFAALFLYGLVTLEADSDRYTKVVKGIALPGSWKRLRQRTLATVYQLTTMSFLLYFQLWTLGVMFLIIIILSWSMIIMLNQIAELNQQLTRDRGITDVTPR